MVLASGTKFKRGSVTVPHGAILEPETKEKVN